MRPFSDMDEGRQWLSGFLEKKGFRDITETERYAHWDLEGYDSKGEKWCFELKNRSFPSDRFGDVAINKDKYDWLMECPHRVILVEFFDDCFFMVDVKNRRPDSIIERQCSRTTRFSDRTVRDNKMVIWKIQDMVRIDYSD